MREGDAIRERIGRGEVGRTNCQQCREVRHGQGSLANAAKATGNAVGDAAKATGDWLAGSKDTAVKAAQDKVADLEVKWQTLQDKAAPTTDAAKADLQKAKDQMAQTLADAKAKLVQAKDATDDAWQKDVKPALAAALDKAQKLYDDAAAKFGSKQAT